MQRRTFDQLGRWERAELGRELRGQGLSYGEIRMLIPVPLGTLAGWCRDIELTPGQRAAITARTGSRKGVPRDTQKTRRLEVEAIQAQARHFAAEHRADPFWVAGTVLYWAEGAKTARRLSLTNSDPRALRLFIAWVRRYLVDDAEFVLSLHLHTGNDDRRAQRYWREALSLPESPFSKTFIKPEGTGHRKNHLPHGVCRVVVRRSANAWIRAMEWVDTVASDQFASC